MSTALGMALCALIGVAALVFSLGALFGLGIFKLRFKDLESETKLLYELSQSQQKYIESQRKFIEQSAYNIIQLSESCSQIDDLDTEIKANQKRVEHALEMIEELKAKRSMDILDKLREED